MLANVEHFTNQSFYRYNLFIYLIYLLWKSDRVHLKNNEKNKFWTK